MVNVTVDYMLKSDENRIIINDFVQGEPLSEENLDRTLNIVTEFNKRYRTTQDIVSNEDNDHNILNENVNKIRLLLPDKTIWLYTGYKIKEIYDDNFVLHPSASDITKIEPDYILVEESKKDKKRSDIIKLCDILVDGRYMDKLRDVSLRWRGSLNQRVIDIKQTLQKGKVVLWVT